MSGAPPERKGFPMRFLIGPAGLAALALAAPAVASAASPAVAGVCAPQIVDQERTYYPVMVVAAKAVSPAPITTMTVPRCDDTPFSGSGIPAPTDPVTPETVGVHGIRGVRHQIAVATPVRAAGKFSYRVYVRHNVCRTQTARGTARFLTCLRAYSKRTA